MYNVCHLISRTYVRVEWLEYAREYTKKGSTRCIVPLVKKSINYLYYHLKFLRSILTYDWLVSGHRGAFFFIVQSAFTWLETLLAEFVEFVVHLYVNYFILKLREHILLAKNFTSSGEEGQTLNFTFKSQNKIWAKR